MSVIEFIIEYYQWHYFMFKLVSINFLSYTYFKYIVNLLNILFNQINLFINTLSL